MKYLFVVSLLFILTSCQEKSLTHRIVLKENQAKNVLNQKAGTYQPSRRFDSLPSFLIDLPQADTLDIRYVDFLNQRKLKALHKTKLLDSLSYSFDTLQRGVYVVNGYRNDKQFIVVDANNNYSFKDDTIVYFNQDFKHRIFDEPAIKNSVPFVTITYDDFDGKGISKKQLKVKPIPYKLDHQKYWSKEQIEKAGPRIINDIFDTKLYYQIDWRGKLNLEQQEYVVNVTKGFNKPRIAFYKDGHHVANERYYRMKDSVNLEGLYYVIDSITPIWDTLFIKKLNIKAPKWGYLKGEKSVDFMYKSITGYERKISDLLKDKEYVLIDFWGTWCGPCKELTPDLVRMSKQYDNLSLLSVAYDRKIEPLLKYINKHKMDWDHVFVQGNAKSGTEKKPSLIKNFAIEAYPTFILINKDLEIIYRDTGRPGLEKIEKIINNH